MNCLIKACTFREIFHEFSQSEDWGPNDWGNDQLIVANSTIVGGLAYYLNSLVSSSSVLTYDYTGWWLKSTGMYANQYMELGSDTFVLQTSTTWNDPIPDLLNSINELTFRTAVQVAIDSPNSTFAQEVVYNGTESATIYQSNYTLMAIAVATNFLGLFSILPVYYGWWELGRKTSLSPLETTKAFGAPLLSDVDDNATAEEILKRAGEMRVKYGESSRSIEEGTRVLISRKELRGRLQIVEEERAGRLKTGNVFRSRTP
jgi:hypothetical protein